MKFIFKIIIFQKWFQWFYFSNSNNKNSADLFIGKQIQPTGIRNIVNLNKGQSMKMMLQSLEEHNLLTNGTGVLIGNELMKFIWKWSHFLYRIRIRKCW
ncbi:unnamed protein product [Blepharisma stoltei]|uniref:Uncharacterized protein n=1 Tax=Blepharisma stoltei TaxID=1481888 RepID=A0AAU9I407_9CILI|nr:unnamed protein product [Blepharisma stoltei]